LKKHFCTFASSDLNKSLLRIKLQAQNLKFYDNIFTFTELDLDNKFKERFLKYLQYGVRGYGYWSWKPQIILQALNLMQDGDILQYTDVGCHLNNNGIKRLSEYFEITNNTEFGILAFQFKPPEFPFNHDGRKLLDCMDYKFIKGDLLDFFNIRTNHSILYTQTITAGVFFIKKTPETINFIYQWLEVIKHNFKLIDDSKSISINLNGFVEHRHDQAIFTILCKMQNIKTISSYEYWYPSKKNINKPDWSILSKYPILAKRDKKYNLKSTFLVTIWRIRHKLNKYNILFFNFISKI
jgi:hypothetical protein